MKNFSFHGRRHDDQCPLIYVLNTGRRCNAYFTTPENKMEIYIIERTDKAVKFIQHEWSKIFA